MSIFRRKKQTDAETESLKSFLDMIAPSIVKFETGYYICGNTFRCIWALREYPTSTDDLAILRHLGEKHGVTLHIYTRMVSPLEERKIVHNAEIRNLWFVVHSLSTLIVTGDCPYSDREIGQILTGFSVSICKSIKEIPGFADGSFDRDAVFRCLIN